MDKARIGTLAMQVNLWASLGYGLMLLSSRTCFATS